jgi:superfamily II DNA/RNA helicase
MFSATFDTNVRKIATNYMNEFYYISKSSEDNNVNQNISHEIFNLEENEKLLHLHGMLQQIKGLVISKLYINFL